LQQHGLSCLKEATLSSYRYVLFDLSDTQLAFQGSVIYGTLSAALIILFAFAALFGFSRSKTKLQLAEGIFSMPVATPGAIIALGLIVTCSGRFGINLYNTAWIAVLAFFIKHFNLAFQPLKTGLGNISSSLFEAAQLSGAGRWETWGRVVLPMLKADVMGAFFLVLIPILGELTMSIFLVSPKFQSIGTVLFDLQDYADQSSAAALSMILIVVILVVNEAARILSKGRLGY
jgi:iron(III) transport system permease protein